MNVIAITKNKKQIAIINATIVIKKIIVAKIANSPIIKERLALVFQNNIKIKIKIKIIHSCTYQSYHTLILESTKL